MDSNGMTYSNYSNCYLFTLYRSRFPSITGQGCFLEVVRMRRLIPFVLGNPLALARERLQLDREHRSLL